MQKVTLLNLSEGISSWAELEARISDLPSEMERGEAFEEFCKAFFLLDPVFQVKKIYRQKEIPHSLREQLGYHGTQDIGIDGFAVTIDGKLIAYQAKFRKDRNNIPTLRELSTFFTVSDKADWRITITNANSLPSAINDRTKNSRVLADRLDQLEPNFFDRLRRYLKEQTIIPSTIKIPHKTQKEAIDKALVYFKEHDRGQLILPCGTGKTLTAMWIAEKIEGKRILVMLPSLALMSQTLREWAANTSISPFRYLCLCSDTTVDLSNDSPIEHLYEMDIPVTTDTQAVSDFLKQEPLLTSVLFSTYQSSKVLSEATKIAGINFDTAILDEAHRTTGSNVGVWNNALDDKNIQIKRRIFITATPRVYAPHISEKAKEKDIILYSMDDDAVYGKPFYEMTFGEAIKENLITDYKVIIICITDCEVRKIIQQDRKIIIDDMYEWNAKVLAKQIAIVKAINAYRLKKIFTFHSRVSDAKSFTSIDSSYGIKQVVKMINPAFGKGEEIKLFHLNGTMSSGIRNNIMKDFENSEIGIMSNARCLIEGVNVPVVDTVAFIDSKKSIIDIIQATGRALRKAEWKRKGYIFIPVVVDEDADPEELVRVSDFNTVWEVLQAMMDQDQKLQAIVSQLRTMQGEGKEGTQEWKEVRSKYGERVEFYNLPKKIDQTFLIEKLYTKTLEIIARTWDFWYGLTIRHKEEFGDANVPQAYETPEGYSLGYWQGNQRRLYKRGKLDNERVRKLKGIGFKLSPLEDAFEKGFRETLIYKEQFGDANAPKRYKTSGGFNLGNWQIQQRQNYNKGLLSSEKNHKLEKIGFTWRLRIINYKGKVESKVKDTEFETGYQKTLKHKEQYGDANISGEEELYSLVSCRRKYKEQYGDVNVSGDHKSFDEYALYLWQEEQRIKFKEGILDASEISRLEQIGFKWTLEPLERGYLYTLIYKDQFGDANVPPEYKTPQGFPLGLWQIKIRHDFVQNRLDAGIIRRLEEIGFKWEIKKK